MIHERAYAKINLGLQVLNKREDGYHNIKSIITSIDLHDDLFIGMLDEVVVECDKFVCRQEDNLVYKVAMLLREKYNVEKGTKIHIGKNIKIGGGLGGGSSNAAAAIRGLNKLWNLGMDYNEMYEFGKTIGSDVAFCLRGGLSVVEGRGEILSPLPFELDFCLVVVYPPYSCSTASVYKAYRELGNDDRFDKLYWEIISNNVHDYAKYLFNDLELVVDNMNKKTGQTSVLSVKKQLIEAGCIGALMSGSGSAVYGLVENYDDARDVAEKIKRIYPNYYVTATYGKRKAII